MMNPTTVRGFDNVIAQRRVTAHGLEIIPPQGYRSPAWHNARMHSVSASEIAGVLGISPYQSRFDLWWAKRNGEHGSTDNQAMRRGRRVEPLVLEDLADHHPELHIVQVGLIANVLRGWQVCTPDGLAYESNVTRLERFRAGDTVTTHDPIAVVEAKTAGSGDGWGERGTDDIPVHYRAQVQWQMDVLGLTAAFIPVWVGFDYREYVMTYDEGDCLYMRAAAREFLSSLEAGIPPDVDGHPATTSRLRKLHPSVTDGKVEVSPHVVAQYQAARRLKDAAANRQLLAENRIRSALGDAGLAVINGRKVASRSVYDVKASVRPFPAYTVNKLNVSKPQPTKGKKDS